MILPIRKTERFCAEKHIQFDPTYFIYLAMVNSMVSIEQTFLSLGELFRLGNGQPKMGRGFCSPQSTREGGSAILLSRSHVCYLPTLRYSLCIYIYFDLQVSTHDIHVLMLYPVLLYRYTLRLVRTGTTITSTNLFT